MKSEPTSNMIYFKAILISVIYLLFSYCTGYSQDNILVSGTISDINGTPLPNTAVSVEGVVEAPVLTDSSGFYTINAPNKNVWLIISPAQGHKRQRVYLDGRKNLNLRLTPDDLPSDHDVVATLYGESPKRNILSSVYVPDQKNALHSTRKSVDQSYLAEVPGIFSTIQSGTPGASMISYIRGVNSIYTNNQPLYIVDGIPMETPGIYQSNLEGYNYNPLFSIDPQDVTSITVYKDYLHTSIHGMRASNGVIIIETLKPGDVKTSINFSYCTGVSMKSNEIPQLNAQQYKTLANEVLMSSPFYEEDYRELYTPLFSTSSDPDYYKYNHNTNWQEKIFRNGIVNDLYMKVTGGDEIAKYGLSVSYHNSQGIIQNTNADRFNVRFVGDFDIVKWLRLNISTNLVSNQANLRESALSYETSPVLTGLFKSPLLIENNFDKNGNQLQTLAEVNSLGVSNPIAIINNFEGHSQNYRFTTSFRIGMDVWKDFLKFNSLLGINMNSLNENIFTPNIGMELYNDGEVFNASKSMKNFLYSVYIDNYLNFKKEIKRKHVLSANAGLRIYKNAFQIDWGIAKNAHERDHYKQLQNGVSYLREMGGENAKWNRLAYYSNLGYSFRDKYLIQLNAVSEFSTRTGTNNPDLLHIGGEPFGLFYSAGLMWRISSEPVLRDIPWLGHLNLRMSYGTAGNDDIGNYTGLDYLTIAHYRETSGMIPGVLSDRSVRFESNSQLNSGLDFSLSGSRLSMSFDWFYGRTKDLLVFEPQPSYTGFSIVPANNGEISNNGFEFSVLTRIVQRQNIFWDLSLNIAHFKNEVRHIKDNAIITPFNGGYFISKVGAPIISFYGYNFEGVYATTEEAESDGLTTETGEKFGAGDAKFSDISGPDGVSDGVIDYHDRTLIGSPLPDIYGGVINRIRFKNWGIMAHIQFVQGNEIYNYVRSQNEKMAGLENQSKRTLQRWTKEGQITDVPRAAYGDPFGNADFSSRWIEDGSFIRLKQLSISYKISQNVLMLRDLEIFATASDLFTLTRYIGYDPEFSYSYYTMEQGIDYGNMPKTTKYMIGIKLGL